MNKNIFLKNIFFLSLLSLGTGCNLMATVKKNIPGNGSGNAGLGSSGSGEVQSGSVGIKNLNQLAYSMSAVTGVPLNSSFGGTTIADHNNIITPFLSGTGSAEDIGSTLILTSLGLAGGFCSVFIANDAALSAGSRKAHGLVDFSRGVSSLSRAVSDSVNKKYFNLFLGRDPSQEELDVLFQAAQDAASGITTSGTQAAQQMWLVPCTAVLSSPDFLRS